MSKLVDEIGRLDEFGVSYIFREAILFYGYAGVGKTRFSTYFPIVLLHNFLLSSNEVTDKTTYVVINTDFSFSFDDLQRITEANGIDYARLTKHLWVEHVKSQDDLLAVLRTIFKVIKDGKRDVKLIAIDKINDPYYEDMISYTDKRTFLSFTKDLTGGLVTIIKQLLSYASRYDIILSWSARRRKPREGFRPKKWYQDVYAGHILQYAPSIVVRLEKIESGNNKVKLKVMKNRHGNEGGEIIVEFTDYGFKL